VKPPPFEYHAPDQVDDVLELLGRGEDAEVRVLAGGQSLVPVMNFRMARPDALVDIGRVAALRSIRREEDGALAIGAGVRQSQAMAHADVQRGWPLLVEGMRHIGHPQIRSRGTVCGSLAHHDPSSELPALAVALDAQMTLVSARGRRRLAAADFFVSYFETALAPDELLLQVAFPPLPEGVGWSFHEIARRRGDFAIVGAVALLRRDADGAIVDPRIVAFGAGSRPIRCSAAEAAARGRAPSAALGRALADAIAAEVDPVGDLHGSVEYRRAALGTLVARAVAESCERAAA